MNQIKVLSAAIFSFALLINTSSSLAQTEPGTSSEVNPAVPTGQPSSPSNITDFTMIMSQFNNDTALNLLHHANVTEILEANEALYRLENDQARNLTQTLIIDHQGMEQQVYLLSAQKGLPLYSYQPSTVEIAANLQLDALTGSNYDLAYLQHQLQEHQATIQNLKGLQSQLSDVDLQNLVNQSIQTIQNHITMISNLVNTLSTSTGSTPTPTPSEEPQL